MVKKSALLVGATGFAGLHMQDLLFPNYNVVATGSKVDIRNKDQMKHLVMSVNPDVVINLASITTVRESFDNPFDTYNIGFLGTLNLLMALNGEGFKGRVLNISSSEVYGFPVAEQLPITEEAPLSPMSPYSVSKVATEMLCYQWNQTETFEVVTARPFTHIGPRQSDRFAISNFAKQVAEIILKKREPILYVGDIAATRDFTDVRDVVRAYEVLLKKGRGGNAYNVCSNKEITTRSLLGKLIEYSNVSVKIESDPSRLRKSEQRRIRGNNEKIHKETGWSPEISLDRTLADTLSFWVEKLG